MTNVVPAATVWFVALVLWIPHADGANERTLGEPAIVIDAASRGVLHAESANRRWAPASLAKLMTLYLAFEAIEAGKLNRAEPLTISKTAAGQPPVRLGLRSGQTLSAIDTITAVATSSANDAAVVLAESLAGSESAFAARMTKTARRLGMSRTVFVNASGLPAAGQYTTARDMALLAVTLIEHFPQHYGVFATRSFRHASNAHATTNALLSTYSGADGMKTGFTCDAGYNLVASAERDGRRLVGVVLGSGTARERNRRMRQLLDMGFRDAQMLQPRIALGALLPNPDTPGQPPPKRLGPSTCARVASAGTRRLSGWGLLLGVFAEKRAARAAVVRARRALSGTMNSGWPVYLPRKLPNGTSWKAAIVGLRRKQAGRACKRLWEQQITCLAQSPQLLKHPRYATR